MITFHIAIDDERRQTVTADALSKEDAAIFITAASMPEALDLIPEGEALAAAACGVWEPIVCSGDAEAAALPTHRTAPVSIEEGQNYMREFEATTAGARFVKGIKKAADFTYSHEKLGMNVQQLYYLANMAWSYDTIGALAKAYCYAYRRGFMDAKKKGGKK